MELVAFEQGLF